MQKKGKRIKSLDRRLNEAEKAIVGILKRLGPEQPAPKKAVAKKAATTRTATV